MRVAPGVTTGRGVPAALYSRCWNREIWNYPFIGFSRIRILSGSRAVRPLASRIPAMTIKSRAAVAFGRQPAPADRRSGCRAAEEGRGAGAHRRHRRVPHRRLHALGRRPRGHLPVHPRPRGRRHRRGGGRRRDLARGRRPRDPAVHGRMPRVQVLQVGQDQPVPGGARHPGQGPDARRHHAASRYQGQPIYHYMGTSTFSEYTVVPEISLAKIRQGRAARQGLPARLRRHHRHRRGAQHGQGGRTAPTSPSSAWAASAWPRSSARRWPKADAHHRGGHQPGQVRHRRASWARPTSSTRRSTTADPGRRSSS